MQINFLPIYFFCSRVLQLRYFINKALVRETFGGADVRAMSLEEQRREGFLTIANAKKLHETQVRV